jgi:enterobactin synthetase component D
MFLKIVDNPNLHLLANSHCSAIFNYDFSFDDIFDSLTEEYAFIRNFDKFSQKRKIEFLAGRYCVREAFKKIDNANKQIVIDVNDDRSPRWPEGFIGSITHAKNFASAIVFPSSKVTSIGIDSELIISLARATELSDMILTVNELNLFRRNFELNVLVTAFFSAKESIFKCFYSITFTMFDFKDVEIFFLCPYMGEFKFRLLKDISSRFKKGHEYSGNVVIDKVYVHTAVKI